jgi:hypothetical protein
LIDGGDGEKLNDGKLNRGDVKRKYRHCVRVLVISTTSWSGKENMEYNVMYPKRSETGPSGRSLLGILILGHVFTFGCSSASCSSEQSSDPSCTG